MQKGEAIMKKTTTRRKAFYFRENKEFRGSTLTLQFEHRKKGSSKKNIGKIEKKKTTETCSHH